MGWRLRHRPWFANLSQGGKSRASAGPEGREPPKPMPVEVSAVSPLSPKNPVTTASLRASRAPGVKADVVVIGVHGAPDDDSGGSRKAGRRGDRSSRAAVDKTVTPAAGS